ncbi:Leucine-rich repeat receptor-like protein kinase PEPR1 [Linum grandiflorum]
MAKLPFFFSISPIIIFLLTLSIQPFKSESSTSPLEISALKSFISSISPSSIPSWSCLASWNFSGAGDPCLLPRRTEFICGITCDESSRITQLTLDSVGYSGRLTPLISQLKSLIILDLAENSFSGEIPASISQLSSLQSLILRSNSFTGSVPVGLAGLKRLESVDLSMNRLVGGLPEGMDSMTSLRRLDLSFNRLTGSLPKKLPPNLVELALKANSISGKLVKSTFDSAAQLEVVELGGNHLAGKLESWFFDLPAIQQVNLANNSFTAVEVGSGGGGRQLVAVDLGFNLIGGGVPAGFAGFPSLSALSMRYNRLRGEIPLELSKKRSLRRLFLDGNFLIGKPPAGFFGGGAAVAAGSLADNCLDGCPAAERLCSPSQKSRTVCKDAYSGRKWIRS